MVVGDKLKALVKIHWENEPCGSRYGTDAERRLYFQEISEARYALEPYIPAFARFESAAGKRVLEIGVGAGADFEHWCRYAEHATGVDLTEAATQLTAERMALSGVSADRYDLLTADAENLTFDSNTFDIIYSWGVLHHTPRTANAFGETLRVLRPGGTLRAMIYHVPSWTGFLLYLQYGLLRGKPGMSAKQAIYHHLESPGTKAYTLKEARRLLKKVGFSDIQLSTKLGPGDLLTIRPGAKYSGGLFRLVWKFYPRPLVRLLGDRYGLNLMITARKPDTNSTVGGR